MQVVLPKIVHIEVGNGKSDYESQILKFMNEKAEATRVETEKLVGKARTTKYRTNNKRNYQKVVLTNEKNVN